MLYNEHGALIGLIGVYVDDFLLAGDPKNHEYRDARQRVLDLYTWGKWQTSRFTLCGVEFVQKQDFSIQMTQHDFTHDMTTFDCPSHKKQAQSWQSCRQGGHTDFEERKWIIAMAGYEYSS